jgi:transcriptional regulator with XRE-family HTH domain
MGTEGDFLEVNYKRIAHNIKNLRKHYHMTQAQLAEKLDMDTHYYSVIERADTPNRNFTLEKVLTACHIFNCTPNDIIGTDFISDNHHREMLLDKINHKIDDMSEHQLNIVLAYIDKIIPLM